MGGALSEDAREERAHQPLDEVANEVCKPLADGAAARRGEPRRGELAT